MALNDTLSRRLRLGMVGGGSSSSIGPSHVAAARLDGQWELVAGVFSRDKAVNTAAGVRNFLAADRVYSEYQDMARTEAKRPDRIDAVTVCTYNDTHFEVADAFLSQGIHVFCDKPLTVSREQACKLVARAQEKNCILAVTYTYSGYPMVRMARDYAAQGRIGKLLSVQVEYLHQYLVDTPFPSEQVYNPAASDILGVVAALGSHAFHMAEFVSGLRVKEIAAQLSGLRGSLDDHANVLLRLEGGVPGSIFTTSVSHGSANGLKFHLIGSEGSLTWHQESPDHLRYSAAGIESTILTRSGPSASPAARVASRIPEGHPEGYLEAFANIYAAVARAIREGRRIPSNDDFPTGDEGARGVAFMMTALASARAGSRFLTLDS